MRRHVIAGKFGTADKIVIPHAADEVLSRLSLLLSKSRLGLGMGKSLDDLTKLGVYPSELGLDLLILAAHVHAADTRISRTSESQDGWTRELRLVVPVSDVDIWRRTSGLLQRMLNFLTGDIWSIDFRPRPKGFQRLIEERQEQLIARDFDGVNLFSGGLDSLIGAIDRLSGGTTPLFVSHVGDTAASEAQTRLVADLEKHFTELTIDRLRVWMAADTKLVRKVNPEMTTRARSFLFFSLGAFAGTGLGKKVVLRAPENGLIALNVPLDPLRPGALSTRTTHPFYIARWNELLQALGMDIRIENPYWDKTKGEMAIECKDKKLLKRLARLSMSCSSPAKARWAGRPMQHCGFCVPCIIRRAALTHAFGAKGDDTTYTVSNLKARTLSTKRAEGQQIRAFQYAAERLNSAPKLASVLIFKPGPLTDEPKRVKALAAVYRRGMAEVSKLLRSVVTQPI